MARKSNNSPPKPPTDKPVKKIGYARVSTSDQSPDMQIAALKAYGVPEKLIFVDKASGSTMDRPQFNRAIRMCQHEGSEFVVWKLDRLGRTLSGVLDTLELLSSRGVDFISLTERIDTKGPMGKAMIRLLAVFAELERDLIAERTKAGVARAKERGTAVGRPEVMTPKRVEVAIKMYEDGAATLDIWEAMKKLGPPPISKAKVYKWVKAYKATLETDD